MSDTSGSHASGGPSHRHVEIGVAVAMAVFGAITILGSYLAGTGWGAEGPRSGFFPFWIGMLIVVASAVNLISIYVASTNDRVFADWHQLRQVTLVVVPTAIYVTAIAWIGIYISSAVLVGAFMRYFGRYNWLLVVGISVGLPIVLYVVFEHWFLVPLPKGPVEDWLGL